MRITASAAAATAASSKARRASSASVKMSQKGKPSARNKPARVKSANQKAPLRARAKSVSSGAIDGAKFDKGGIKR